MRILSIKRHLSADHSSSTYQFVAVDKLTSAEKKLVADLTGETPTGQELYVHYWGERETPWKWHEQLLGGPYDVSASESYDHWQAEFTMPYEEELHRRIEQYGCGGDVEGFEVDRLNDRTYCILNFYAEYSSDFFGYDDEEDPVKQIADLFVDIRAEILEGDLSALRVIFDTYGSNDESNEDRPELDPKKVKFSKNARSLQSFLVSI